MTVHPRRTLITALAVCLLAAACRGQASPPPAATATLAPTWTPAPSFTPPPTATAPVLPSLTETEPVAASETPTTDAAATATPPADASATHTSAPAGAGTNLAEFVADVTVPDGTDFAPDEAFVKTWQLRNIGTATWTTSYRLVYVSGEQMGGPAGVNLPSDVPPGGTVDISVDLTAPTRLGTYTGFWMLSTPGGTTFGLGPQGNQPVYVQIDTVAAPGGGGNPGPTAPAGSISLTSAELTVDQANLSGTCPQTFQFRLTFTSSGAGTVTYKLEAQADNPGFSFNLPDPSNSIFNNAGPRTFGATYDLEFTNSVSGQIWVHFTNPSELVTNKVPFSLTCAATPTGGNTPTP